MALNPYEVEYFSNVEKLQKCYFFPSFQTLVVTTFLLFDLTKRIDL